MDIDVPNRGQILSKRFLTCYSLKTIQLKLTTVNGQGSYCDYLEKKTANFKNVKK